MDNKKKLKIFIFVLILVLYASLLTFKISLPAADDMARHVVNGQMILEGHFDVLYKNFYSYTMPGQPFVNHHWFFGVISYLLYKVVGWSGLVVFKVLVFLAIFSLLFWLTMKKSNFWLASFFSLPTMLILLDRAGLRPEVFSYLFIVLFMYLFFYFEEHPDSKRIFWLIPIQLLWVNIHIFFIAGLGMTGGFLLEKIVLNWRNLKGNKMIGKLSLIFVALLGTSVINPNGITGALYPLRIFENYGMNVSENNSIFFFLRNYALIDNLTVVIFLASIILLVGSLFFILKKKPKPVFLIMGSLATAAVGIKISRMFSTFGLFFLPTICLCLNEPYNRIEARIRKSPLLTKWLSGIFITILLILIFFIGFWGLSDRLFNDSYFGVGLVSHAEDAGNFLVDNNIKGPIFNDYDIGSYLIYRLYPKEKVFVDNRPEAFSKDFFKNTYLPIFSSEDSWEASANKFGFNAIILYRYDQGPGVNDFMYNREKDPAWALVYVDNYAIIFVKNTPENKPIIDKFQITPDNVQDRMAYLIHTGIYEDAVAAADNFNLVGRTDLGMQTFFNVVHKWPNKGKIWMVMGEWELGNNNPKSPILAIIYIENALREGYITAEAYYSLAKAYAVINYTGEAKLLIHKALELNPGYGNADDLYNSIAPKS